VLLQQRHGAEVAGLVAGHAALDRDPAGGQGRARRWTTLRMSASSLSCSAASSPPMTTVEGLHGNGEGGLASRHPTFVGVRQQHLRCVARTAVDPARGTGGLALRIDDTHVYAVEATAESVRAEARIGPLAQQLAARAPDAVRLAVEAGDEIHVLPELDGRDLSTDVAWRVHRPRHRAVRDRRGGRLRLVRVRRRVIKTPVLRGLSYARARVRAGQALAVALVAGCMRTRSIASGERMCSVAMAAAPTIPARSPTALATMRRSRVASPVERP
jgi:hypothetical protein